jgi:hypothetical protein
MVVKDGLGCILFLIVVSRSWFFFLEGKKGIDGTAKREQIEGCAIWATGIGRNAKAKCSNCSQTYGVKR